MPDEVHTSQLSEASDRVGDRETEDWPVFRYGLRLVRQ